MNFLFRYQPKFIMFFDVRGTQWGRILINCLASESMRHSQGFFNGHSCVNLKPTGVENEQTKRSREQGQRDTNSWVEKYKKS